MAKKVRKPIALEELKVEYVLPSELKPNAYNPNRQTEDEFEMLKASMREDGFTTPILVMTDGIESAGGIDGLLQAKPAIALTAAGQNRRFVDMADGDILSFGPRSASVLDALARAVYAP